MERGVTVAYNTRGGANTLSILKKNQERRININGREKYGLGRI